MINVDKSYKCENCNYCTSKKTDYNRHLLTIKHLNMIKNSEVINNKSIKMHDEKFQCFCGKLYKHYSSYCRHIKNCNDKKELVEKELVDIIKTQSGQINQALKVINDITPHLTNQNVISNSNNTTNNTVTINNNFNINLFLNEDCKDALNLDDFVKSIEVKLKDLEFTKDNGYVKGITNILVRELKQLDQTKRPIHCIDEKRDTLYVKNKNKWTKEIEETEPILNNAIKTVEKKQSSLVKDWMDVHDLEDDTLKDEAILLINKTTQIGGEDKIIKGIAKEVLIDKEN